MVSKFEDILLRCNTYTCPLRKKLFDFLGDGNTLRRLRATSRVLHDLVDHHPGRLFRNLYIRTSSNDVDSSINILLPFCHNLTITIGKSVQVDNVNVLQGEVPPARGKGRKLSWSKSRRAIARTSSCHQRRDPTQAHTSTICKVRASLQPPRLVREYQVIQDHAQQRWTTIFSSCHQVQSLTLRIHGDAAWPGRTIIEDTLIAIRTALEISPPPLLRHLHLNPIHAMGIIHLRFTSLAAFGCPPPPLSPDQMYKPLIWETLHTLDLQIHNPFPLTQQDNNHRNILSPVQNLMFKKILYDYLRSFTPTLHFLRLIWIDGNGEGPSPLGLHTEPGLESRHALIWPKLKVLWIGGVAFPHRTIQLVRTEGVAPNLERLMVLRDIATSRTGKEEDTWMDVLLGPDRSDAKTWTSGVQSAGSASVYSRSIDATSSMFVYDSESSDVSKTSRVVPFTLDLSGKGAASTRLMRPTIWEKRK